MKYFIVIVLVLAAMGGAALYVVSRAKAASTANANAPQTEAVSRLNLEKIITANGKVASNRDVDIKCKASGEIIKLPYDVSQFVKQGDVLLEVDEVDMARSLKQSEAAVMGSQARVEQAKLAYQQAQMNLVTGRARAEADLASARARAADAHSKADRAQALFDAKPTPLASKEELETAQTTAAQADASVLTAEAAVKELDQQKIAVDSKKQDIALAETQLTQDTIKRDLAKQQLDYCKVIAPVDGVVSALNVQVGNIVQSGSSGFSGGTTVMTISDLSHIFVLASVDESDIGNISDPSRGEKPQKVHVSVDAFPREQFEGEVVRVASKGLTSSNVVTFEVKIEVTSPNRTLLRPEMTGTAKIVKEARENVLAIASNAFVRKQPDETPVVAASAPADAATRAGRSAPAGETASSEPATGTAPAATATARAGRGGGGRGGRTGRGSYVEDNKQEGSVSVMKADGSTENRDVVVGLLGTIPNNTNRGEYYEVISGLEEGDVVVLNKSGGDSKWRANGPNAQQSMRLMGGGGGGRGR